MSFFTTGMRTPTNSNKLKKLCYLKKHTYIMHWHSY